SLLLTGCIAGQGEQVNPESTGQSQPATTQTTPPTTEPQLLLDWSTVSKEAPKNREVWKKEWANTKWEKFLAFMEEERETEITRGVQDIPVYFEADLFFDTNGLYFINRDSSFWEGQNAKQNYTGDLLRYFPTTAIRDRGDGMLYLMYATETGYRMYLHLSDYNDYTAPTGFPIIIGEELLSYADFKELAVGDPIDKVTRIDPVASLIQREITEVWELDPAGSEGLTEWGYPVTTVHYLRDGILKIEYGMQEDLTLFITNMVYNKNYELVNHNGRTVNYWIETVDLPATTQKYVCTLAPRPEFKAKRFGNERLEVPVYSEEELLFNTDGLFYLGQRNRLGKKYTAKKNGTDLILERYPTTAIREKKNGTKYLMYDTDTGYRLYLFLDKKNDYATPVYAPIVIGEEVLSYEDFQGLKRGDTIADVIEIDPVAGLVYKEATEVLKLDKQGLIEFGGTHPITSVHYLQEGILEISYTQYMKASTVEPRIENMNLYDHDHMIVSHRAVDCQIEEIDLPKS
ncbi:MAG: hypothetical protein IJB15_10870, partial [Clostridia bacterium]|nr:hypothetical protein [Clostridia bacterium]